MERKKRFDVKKLNTRLALAVLIVAISLVLAGSGCGWQTASSYNQLKLQSTMDNHAQQIASNMLRIEEITKAVNDVAQNQAKLQEQIVAVQNNTDLLRENMIAVLKQLKDQLSQISSQISSTGTWKK